MLNPFKCFNGWGSRLEKSQDPKSWEESQSSRILKTLGVSVDDAINNRVSKPINRENLIKDLKSLSRKDLEVCKNRLESMLISDVLNLLFGNNLGQVKQNYFSWRDVYGYTRTILYDTDFGIDIFEGGISVQTVGGLGQKKLFLTVQEQQEGKNEIHVNIPFNWQYYHNRTQTNYHKIDTDNSSLEYIGKIKNFQLVFELIEFIQKIQNVLEKVPDDRKLGVFVKKTRNNCKICG